MKARRVLIAVCLVLGLFIAAPVVGVAQEKAAMNPSISLKDNLSANVGKRVNLLISAGQSVEGTIEKVGDHFVLISKLSGKDFYDALVRIDDIKAAVYRAR